MTVPYTSDIPGWRGDKVLIVASQGSGLVSLTSNVHVTPFTKESITTIFKYPRVLIFKSQLEGSLKLRVIDNVRLGTSLRVAYNPTEFSAVTREILGKHARLLSFRARKPTSNSNGDGHTKLAPRDQSLEGKTRSSLNASSGDTLEDYVASLIANDSRPPIMIAEEILDTV